MATDLKPRDMAAFHRFTVDELHRLTGLSEHYLINLRDEQRPLTSLFKRRLVTITGISEDVLFGPAQQPVVK